MFIAHHSDNVSLLVLVTIKLLLLPDYKNICYNLQVIYNLHLQLTYTGCYKRRMLYLKVCNNISHFFTGQQMGAK